MSEKINGGLENTRYFVTDHLGSTTKLINTDETEYSDMEYLSWGSDKITPSDIGTSFKYTGQRHAEGAQSGAEAGLYYYNARWYDPQIGRFIQADTIIPEPGNPQAWDRYAYGYNNPVNNIDPSGHKPECEYGDAILCRHIPIKTQAINLAKQYINHRLENGTTMLWPSLSKEEQDILTKAGWNPDIWHDAIGQPSSPADPLHDPAVWISVIGAGIYGFGLIAAGGEIACADGDCTNELTFRQHALDQMAERGVSVDQVKETLNQISFYYFHDGIWKLGYYDPNSKIFVATNETERFIYTVINNVKLQYIYNLLDSWMGGPH